jgi:hypothetical protein
MKSKSRPKLELSSARRAPVRNSRLLKASCSCTYTPMELFSKKLLLPVVSAAFWMVVMSGAPSPVPVPDSVSVRRAMNCAPIEVVVSSQSVIPTSTFPT